MRSRFPLLLKKRGRRRTGSPWWGRSGELLYHCVFIVVGAVACWWQVANVIMPDWRRGEQTALFDQAECLVVGGRVDERAGIAGSEYAPICVVRVASRATGESESDEATTTEATTEGADLGAATEAQAGLYLLDERIAQRTLRNFPVGERVACWVDPDDPRRVVLAHGYRTLPWVLLLIPASLLVLGVVGLARTLLKTGVSVERRQTVAQQAGRFDPFSSAQITLASATALPATHDVDDSPGVKLRYRLPIDGGASWRLAGMTVMCVAWNFMVGFFLVGVVSAHWAGRPNWAVSIVVIPLACAGGWLAYSLLRDAWAATGVGVTQIEIANHPLIPGQTGGGVVMQTGQFRARSLSVSLVCDEIATYCEGTDTRTSTEEVYREVLHQQRRFRIETDRPYEQPFTFTVPSGAMHSFVAPHNEVRWSLEVRGAPMRWPEFRRRFRLCVYPSDPRVDDSRQHVAMPEAMFESLPAKDQSAEATA